jgi:serine phosphatase RsbU (regulator of sigma subunit)/anti-sigma regulatory factor (Ser/Thr protein kinase)
MTSAQKKLSWRLVGAVAGAFVASMILTWLLHEHMTKRDMHRLFDNVFNDVAVDIRERVDGRMFRQAMALRDKIYEMREEAWWNDPDESCRRLRALADDLRVDEITIADADGTLSHSARRSSVGAFNFRTATGQAREFAALLDDKYELSQPLLPNTLYGEMVKYVGVWMPDGGFVQVGAQEPTVRHLARTAVTGLTHGWHVTGDDGGIYITTGNGTIISHPEAGHEGGQWQDPGKDFYCEKRMIEGFPVYIVIPRHTAVVERRVLVATSAFLNGMALILASVLVGIVIAGYVKGHLAAQRAKEMAMAADIQESAIPRTFPPFSEERRMDIFADMNTAKDVGGDFYDFFFSAPNKFTFLIADVSGKGVPAALFMMRAKASIKGVSQTGRPLAEVVAEANDSLSRDNGANMFVTAWVGELDLETGVVTFVNAGHNPPILISCKPGADGRRTSYLRTKPGLVLGMMPGMKYRCETLQLSPGDAIYLYTDGITEQPDAQNKLFGEERLESAIAGMIANGMPLFEGARSGLLSAIMACVEAHGLGVEQADDCTQLIIRFNGSRRGATRTFPPTQDGIADASDFLDEVMGNGERGTVNGEQGIGNGKQLPQLHIILDEICSNIVKHSGATEFSVEIGQLENQDGVKIVFYDNGTPYDPLAHTDPDTSLGAAERPIGGLGILMVKKMSSSISYSRTGDRNVLTVELASGGSGK